MTFQYLNFNYNVSFDSTSVTSLDVMLRYCLCTLVRSLLLLQKLNEQLAIAHILQAQLSSVYLNMIFRALFLIFLHSFKLIRMVKFNYRSTDKITNI